MGFSSVRRQLRFSHFLFLILAIGGLSYPDAFTQAVQGISAWFSTYGDWFVMLICSGFLLMCILLACSRYGRIRLGGQHETPEYDTLSWMAMLFAAGMGTGLVFYGTAEPLVHWNNPPTYGVDTPLSPAQAARQAMTITYLHWGLHAWAIYAVSALAIAYFAFRQQQPMLASAPLESLIKISNAHVVSRIINLVAVMAVVFGLIGSLSQGVTQMQSGAAQAGIASGGNPWEALAILGLLTVCFVISSVTGLGKGIKILSDINMIACILLMLFIFIVGPSHFILESLVTTLGDYISQFIRLGMNLQPYSGNTDWVQGWTVTYFLWWAAWAPFVGIFIARISRGRTIRQFLIGVLLVPTLFSCAWFSTLGGSAIYLDMFTGTTLAAVADANIPDAMFALLRELPLQAVTTAVTLFLIFIFLVTSADSGTFVLGMFTSEGNPNPSRFQRLFWGAIVAVITAVTLFSGQGVDFLRAVALAGSIPYLLIMLVQCAALWAFLKRDIKDLEQPFVQLDKDATARGQR